MADAPFFRPSDHPRLFALPPGVDFPAELVAGLRQRLRDAPPEAMCRVEIFVNSSRMRRRIEQQFDTGGASFLPRLRLVTELLPEAALAGLPMPVSGLRRRLELSTLVARLLDSNADLAPRAALFDLSDSLATLLEEMQGEGVTAEALEQLDLSQHSAHWERALAFIRIVSTYLGGDPDKAPDAEGVRRAAVLALAERWRDAPPSHPVLIAGSTGSRGTTALFMQAVARLPQGAVVLPGFDFTMPDEAWRALDDALAGEDHPQFRFRKLAHDLDLPMQAIAPWTERKSPDAARERLISLALRPAPVTDQWLAEGPELGDLAAMTKGLSLIEAPTPRAEAAAIALALRQAAENGISAALVSPDRGLTRQVTAALTRWNILIDDSAGAPLHHSAPGRFLRQVAALFLRPPGAEELLALLKHPLCASTAGLRGPHKLMTQELDLWLRRKGRVYPDQATLADWAADDTQRGQREGRKEWSDWVAGILVAAQPGQGALPLVDRVQAHLALADRIAAGPDATGSGELWLKPAGVVAASSMSDLRTEAPHGGHISAQDFADLLDSVLERGEVREAPVGYPGLTIWGTLEARAMGADLLILGGLNEGVWPKMPPPDPWLNRRLRAQAGLLLPDRQVGLSAHDFQQAMLAPKVILSRARRDDEAETVASRWLNRLTNLMEGLPGGKQALAEMHERGAALVTLAGQLDQPTTPIAPARRPAPRPPVDARPRELSVTRIRDLIRDPYSVYARHILGLKPLAPLHPEPDARLRGTTLHRILEEYLAAHPAGDGTPAEFMATVDTVLESEIAFAATRVLWRARMQRITDWFLTREAGRADRGRPAVVEGGGRATLQDRDFTLTARPDRIDLLDDGSLHIYDYKTGTIPSDDQRKVFDKQLPLEAAMAVRGGFSGLGPRRVAGATYIGMGNDPKEKTLILDADELAQVWEQLGRLIASYDDRSRGYPSRRAVFVETQEGDYDHLARFGEWTMSDDPEPEDVG
ncbi:MAG: double-strand break repair protein AddB [Paracoccaceae bacterium]